MLLIFCGISGHVLTTTNKIKLPINCVLAGNQPYKHEVKTFESVPFQSSEKTMASGSQLAQLSRNAPSFTVRTNNRGYD